MERISLSQSFILLYIILMPFSLFGPERFGINIKLCDFLFPFLVLTFVIENQKNLVQKVKKAKFLLIFLPFLISGVVSINNSISVGKSLLELISYIYLFLLSIIVVASIDSTESFYRCIRIWLLATVLVLLVGAFGLLAFYTTKADFWIKFIQYTDLDAAYTLLPRIKSTFHTPNMLLTYLHVSIILATVYYYTVVKNNMKKVFARGFLAYAALILGTIILTQSRRIPGVLLSIFLIFKRFSKTLITRYAKYIFCVLFILFLLLSLLTTIWQFFPIEFSSSQGFPYFSANWKLSLHALPHIVSFRMFAIHPLIGNGIGTYSSIFPRFYFSEEIKEKFALDVMNAEEAIRDKSFTVDPHSSFLGTLAEQGILGILTLLFFFIGVYCYIYSNLGRIRQVRHKDIVYILTYGLTGFLLNGFITDILTMRHLWFLLAFIIGFIVEQKGAT